MAWRPFHGGTTAAERIGSNVGPARYRLRLQLWLALLSRRFDSYVLHDVSVVDIVETVFAEYSGLVPARRSDLTDGSQDAKGSVTTKYPETNLGFVQRLLAEEGVSYWLERAGEPASSSRGVHTLVLAGHEHAAAQLRSVRFHRGNASGRSDGVQEWLASKRCGPRR
ncbi:phage late control D family protein [Stenotrophomonas rhizophila]